MSSNLLQQAVQLAQAGQKSEARQLILQFLQTEPNNETAWLWLASVAGDQTEYQRALNEVLRLNPNNQRAQQLLAEFEQQYGGAARYAPPQQQVSPQLPQVSPYAPPQQPITPPPQVSPYAATQQPVSGAPSASLFTARAGRSESEDDRKTTRLPGMQSAGLRLFRLRRLRQGCLLAFLILVISGGGVRRFEPVRSAWGRSICPPVICRADGAAKRSSSPPIPTYAQSVAQLVPGDQPTTRCGPSGVMRWKVRCPPTNTENGPTWNPIGCGRADRRYRHELPAKGAMSLKWSFIPTPFQRILAAQPCAQEVRSGHQGLPAGV
jgi:hypothetical protein